MHDYEVDPGSGFGEVVWTGLCAGSLATGAECVAILGVNATETQSSIDAALTFGILWLEVCWGNPTSRGNIATRQLHATNATAALDEIRGVDCADSDDPAEL